MELLDALEVEAWSRGSLATQMSDMLAKLEEEGRRNGTGYAFDPTDEEAQTELAQKALEE